MVFIHTTLSRDLSVQALSSKPEECIGIFECEEFDGDYYITNIHQVKNVARNKKTGAQIPKQEFKKFSRLIPRLKKKNKFLGVYHSHPSGHTTLSEQDMYSAMIYKMFKLQLILVICGKSKDKIKKGFWKKDADGWEKIKIKVRKRSWRCQF